MKKRKLKQAMVAGIMAGAVLLAPLTASADWQKSGNTYTYHEQNGKVAKGRQYRYLPKIEQQKAWYLTQDGQLLTGVQKWQGDYWFFNQDGSLHTERDYVQSQWGDWYMIGDNGQVLSGVQQWMGSYYYFDPVTYLKLDHQDYVKSQWGTGTWLALTVS